MPHLHAVAFDDQADAAERELSRTIEAIAPQLLGESHDAAPEPWLTARLDGFAAGVEHGAVQLCWHLQNAATPRPAYGVLSLNRLVCRECLPTLIPKGEHLRCDRCDRCGRPADIVEPALANLGTIALLILQCDPCAQLRPAHTDAPGDETRDETGAAEG